MIRITRAACPAVLSRRSRSADRFRNKKVVDALWNMQYEKCCYCELEIPESGHAKAVEHFRPQSVFKYRRNDWSNLLLACAQCNGRKSDKFPVILSDDENEPKVIYIKRPMHGEPAIIDPSNNNINPEAHLDYHLDMSDGGLAGQIFSRNRSILGKTTIEVTGIDQSFFHKQRRQHFRTLVRAWLDLEEAKDCNNYDNLTAAKLYFNNLMADGHKFAGLARAFARKFGLDEKYGLAIPSITEGEMDE